MYLIEKKKNLIIYNNVNELHPLFKNYIFLNFEFKMLISKLISFEYLS